MKEITSRSHVNAKVTLPGSKSITHRALITASLAEGQSLLKEFLASEDTLLTVGGLKELGVELFVEGRNARVSGTAGRLTRPKGTKELFLGNSGTSYRLLLSTAGLGQGEYILRGTPRMHERPIGDLAEALNKLGVEITYTEREGFPPVRVRAKGIQGGKVKVRGDKSSQFVSSLLLASPYAQRDVEIEVTGSLVSQPYVDMTLDVMRMFGIPVDRDGYRYFKTSAGQKYRPCLFNIDGDVSSASYFWAAAAVTGGTVTTLNIHPYSTRQGDIGLLDIMEQMGCRIEKERDQVVVHGADLTGLEVDMAAMPDMVPTLAAVALFAEGKMAIRNVSHLRLKESDRLGAIAQEWQRLGARLEELRDGLIIYGGETLTGAFVDPHDDHRLAMSLAVVGLRVPGVRIENEDCVKKSFPRFWELWDTL